MFGRTIFALLALLASSAYPQTRSVNIPVWTETATPLNRAELDAIIDSQPADIVSLRGPADGLILLVILDVVEDLNRINLAKAALIEAVNETPQQVYIGLLRAQNGLRVLQDPTSDRNAIARAIRDAPVSGTPGLLETITTAADLADSILADAPVRVAVLYITDSQVDEYRENFANPEINESDCGDVSRRFSDGLVRNRISRLDRQLATTQSPIFAVHLEHDTGQLEEAYESGILQMTATTGGSATFCRSNAEIEAVVQATLDRIVNHYRLELRVPPIGKRVVEVTLHAGAPGKLSYRRRYDLTKR